MDNKKAFWFVLICCIIGVVLFLCCFFKKTELSDTIENSNTNKYLTGKIDTLFFKIDSLKALNKEYIKKIETVDKKIQTYWDKLRILDAKYNTKIKYYEKAPSDTIVKFIRHSLHNISE